MYTWTTSRNDKSIPQRVFISRRSLSLKTRRVIARLRNKPQRFHWVTIGVLSHVALGWPSLGQFFPPFPLLALRIHVKLSFVSRYSAFYSLSVSLVSVSRWLGNTEERWKSKCSLMTERWRGMNVLFQLQVFWVWLKRRVLSHVIVRRWKLWLHKIKIQTHKKFKGTLFIRTKHSMRIFGVIPFIKLQNDTSATVKVCKTMNNEMES